jgi:hypothetical protein
MSHHIFQIQFRNTRIAQAVRLSRQDDLRELLENLGLCAHTTTPRPVLVLVGGASGLTPEYLEDLTYLFAQIICPFMESHQGIVVDGGTNAGIMSLMGQARRNMGCRFPLVGVAAQGTVWLPEQDPPSFQDWAFLEPLHTHFVLVPGKLWGDESPWIAKVADLLMPEKSVTLLVNGGKISWQDVTNSVRVQRPVLVLAGSGRTADELALAIRGDRSNQRANQLVDSGLLTAVELGPDWENLRASLTQCLV